jgi:hypothetical protein
MACFIAMNNALFRNEVFCFLYGFFQSGTDDFFSIGDGSNSENWALKPLLMILGQAIQA